MNVSVRKQIDAGGTLTAGFVIAGATSRTVLIRAIGPGLAAFGLTGVMADPQLALFSGAVRITGNDNWGGDTQITAAGTAVGAFAIANTASRDAMLITTLAPGSYTVEVSGVGGSAGETLVEIYEVP
ncbi:MAG: DVUA0089 family protein [Opitutaceae bacterium]|nr:DVUA0089 family protein [Opitutaceae bacterium]